jgi:hypothetical protein
MAQGSKFLVANPGVLNADGALSFVAKASAIYGGMTVIAAHAVTGIAGTLDIVLQNYGTTGTVAGGTVANMASGTATVWAVDTPQSLTVSTTVANLYVAANEWLVIKKLEAGGSDDLSTDASVVIEYVDGIVASN